MLTLLLRGARTGYSIFGPKPGSIENPLRLNGLSGGVLANPDKSIRPVISGSKSGGSDKFMNQFPELKAASGE